ncbi:hypothetical protein AB0M79_30910 [Polymorphospora sp. NPDC051019]|uniref:hypothetical protein n=1 Tax=unclassified Polymorphospora TaxID=2685497 RepID=UPI0033E697BF
MADQPNQSQSWERTVEVPRQEVPLGPAPFRRGVAQVGPRPAPTESFPAAHEHEPTGTGWPGAPDPHQPRMPLSYHMRQLRLGSEWSIVGGLFAFVCWGIWAISARGDLTSPVVTFVLTLFVAAGVFGLSRLLGRVVLERQLGRVRRTAKGAHLATGVFLVGVGIAYLRQTEWVMGIWNWFAALF